MKGGYQMGRNYIKVENLGKSEFVIYGYSEEATSTLL